MEENMDESQSQKGLPFLIAVCRSSPFPSIFFISSSDAVPWIFPLRWDFLHPSSSFLFSGFKSLFLLMSN
ncbi:hypothetical protein CHARACLAT_016755 [Characodon lateralis]|uniref:Uncharacterized protein n=1 Tax=Characodon lateralis TaxID=208331 RepID=A0ABU7CY94_9TELE|nr:hypothetical protein [Characodon lateralis]